MIIQGDNFKLDNRAIDNFLTALWLNGKNLDPLRGHSTNSWLILFFTDEELHVVELEPEELEKCEDISEVSPNTICTKAKEDNGKCLVRNFYYKKWLQRVFFKIKDYETELRLEYFV